MDKELRNRLFIGAAIGLAGWFIVIFDAGWLTGIGLLLAFWGNNMERNVRQDIKTRRQKLKTPLDKNAERGYYDD